MPALAGIALLFFRRPENLPIDLGRPAGQFATIDFRVLRARTRTLTLAGLAGRS